MIYTREDEVREGEAYAVVVEVRSPGDEIQARIRISEPGESYRPVIEFMDHEDD